MDKSVKKPIEVPESRRRATDAKLATRNVRCP